MQNAISALTPVNSFNEGLAIYFLTGEKYLYQTLFCIQSLVRCCSEKFNFHLVDDGSFTDAMIQEIYFYLPNCKVINAKDIAKNIEKAIPADRYPHLHYKRKVYPHIKKLTDIHTIPGNNWKLVLDSDMFFWNSPNEILEWLKNPNKYLCLTDCKESYGYSKELMQNLCGFIIPSLVNVGVIGLNSADINWENLERWTKTLEHKEGTSYYLEQALTAMLLAGKLVQFLSEKNYLVNPDSGAITQGKGILHHYVDLSRQGYYRIAWKKVI